MYALAFDLEKVALLTHYSATSPNNAYKAVRATLEALNFQWVQGSLYVVNTDDMSVLLQAINDLRAIPWFPLCVRDLRGFRVEQWSNFTPLVSGGRTSGTPPPTGNP